MGTYTGKVKKKNVTGAQGRRYAKAGNKESLRNKTQKKIDEINSISSH